MLLLPTINNHGSKIGDRGIAAINLLSVPLEGKILLVCVFFQRGQLL